MMSEVSEKAVSLVKKGAVLAPSAAAANHILGEVGVDLPGKLLVQFSTGSPQDARASQMWAHDQGAEYLDCAILTGSPDSPSQLAALSF